MHGFDDTIAPKVPEYVTFHPWHLGLSDKEVNTSKGREWSLTTIRDALGHTGRPINVLKVGLRVEYGVLSSLSRVGELRDVGQLVLEANTRLPARHTTLLPDRGAPSGPRAHHAFLWKLAKSGWAIFSKNVTAADALGACVVYGLVQLDWNAHALTQRARAHWCVGGWESTLYHQPECRGWGHAQHNSPLLKHLGYTNRTTDNLYPPHAIAHIRLEIDALTSNFRALRRIAFIVPTHSPKFDYAATLLRSFFSHGYHRQARLHLIFSDSNSRETFFASQSIETSQHSAISSLVYTPARISDRCTSRHLEANCIGIAKKLYALAHVVGRRNRRNGHVASAATVHETSQYDYVVLMDSEAEFIGDPEIDLYELIRLRAAQREFTAVPCLGANSSAAHRNLKLSAATVLGKTGAAADKFRLATQNYTLYTWWNDLPIYEPVHATRMLRAFVHNARRRLALPQFHKNNTLADNVAAVAGFIEAEFFEHLIYQAHVVAHANHTIRRVTNATALLDAARPLWIVRGIDPAPPQAIVRFHLDRVPP
mmetsp:Transcript_29025/g.86679  ORF Transcript_29025/g.86679 Transcript_29025/m.86679 type:complete len:539 (-) Transcript_29025:107-1723(-)